MFWMLLLMMIIKEEERGLLFKRSIIPGEYAGLGGIKKSVITRIMVMADFIKRAAMTMGISTEDITVIAN